MPSLIGPPEFEICINAKPHLAEGSIDVKATDQLKKNYLSKSNDTLVNETIAKLKATKLQPKTCKGCEDRKIESKDDNSSANVIPQMGLTEKGSATYLSSGNACLDFFFHVVPDTPAEELNKRLAESWSQDPLTTLKLICHLRGVRGTGKSDKERYYSAALWLHSQHPKTFARNLDSFVEFGYYKDLLEILYRLLEGADVREIAKEKTAEIQKQRLIRQLVVENSEESVEKKADKKKSRNKEVEKAKKAKKLLKKEQREKFLILEKKKNRQEKKLSKANKVLQKYENDPEFRNLHDRISDLFAKRLKSDLKQLKSGNLDKISLAAKWCPSIDSSFDQSTLICESIARKIFPKTNPEYEGVEEAHYAYRVRDRLRKEVLVPLRKALEIPEVFMSSSRWNDLPYNKVPSVAMEMHKEQFKNHDRERFFRHLLENCGAAKTKIAADALLPHEIISSLFTTDGRELAELQWKRIVKDLSKLGTMKNCLAVCDLSYSMNGNPVKVSIALGILVSELCKEPWKGKVITFSENPELHHITGDDLKSKVNSVRSLGSDSSTNFEKVFHLILLVALKRKLRKEAMIKRLFVFTDKEFDQASKNRWETDYEVIKKKFKACGYGNAIPEIIFWNLRNSRSTPVLATEKGVALVSGFSKNILKVFLENGGKVEPVAVMKAAISGKEYSKLKVVD